jgi:hypothetical protein
MTNAIAAATPTNGHTSNGHAPAPPALQPSSDGGAVGSRTAGGRFAKGNHLGRRFAKGNKAGCGNPFTRRLGELRAAFLDAVTDDNVQDLAHALLARALDGDLAAATLFLHYAIGKPGESVNPDDAGQDEWDRMFRRPQIGQVDAAAKMHDPAKAAEAARKCFRDDVLDLVETIRRWDREAAARQKAQAEAPKPPADKGTGSSADALARVKALAGMLAQAGQAAGKKG